MHLYRHSTRRIARLKLPILITVLCFLFNVQTYSEAAQDKLISGDLLLLYDKKIWLLDTTELSETLLFDTNAAADEEVFSDVVVSPDRRFVYIVIGGKERSAINKLIRYDLSLKTLETIYESAELGRISPVSPNGNQMLLSLVNLQIPSWSDCLLNITEKSCQPIDLSYNPNAVFWLEDHKIITDTPDGIVTYELSENDAPIRNVFALRYGDYLANGVFVPSNKRFYAGVNGFEDPKLMSIDSDFSDLAVIPHAPINDSSIHTVSISYDGTLLAYKQALRLTIINAENGALVRRLEDIQRFAWPSEAHKIVLIKQSNRSQYLSLLDLTTGETVEGVLHPGEIYLTEVP